MVTDQAMAGGGGITGLVRSLVTADTLDELSNHTLEFFRESIQSHDLTDGDPLQQFVVFRRLDGTGFRVVRTDDTAEDYQGGQFERDDWPRELWEKLSQGRSVEEVSFRPGWLGADLDLDETRHLQTIPFRASGDLYGFYLLLSPAAIRLPESIQYLGSEFGDIIGELLRFKQDAWQVQDRLKTFEILDEFYEGINQLDDFESILEFCLETFQDLFDAPHGSVMIYDRDRDELKVEHSSMKLTGEPMVFSMGEGVAGTSLEQDELIHLPNVKESRFFKEFDTGGGTSLKSLLCIPLRTPQGPVGVINVSAHDRHHQFPPDRVPGLDIMRSRVASGLENVIMTKKLERVARIDELTGIFNRRSINKRIESLVEDYHQRNTPFGVLLIDLDDFKSINDRYGHQIGDRVLCRFAQELDAHSRPRDVVGRFGGDEFIYLLPDTEPEEAVGQGQFLVDEMDSMSVTVSDGERIHPTASLGLSTVSGEVTIDDSEVVIQVADQCLYEAKNHSGFFLSHDQTRSNRSARNS